MGDPIDLSKVYDLGDGTFRHETLLRQDITDILARNKAERESSDGFSDKRTMRKIMSISPVDYVNALQAGYRLESDDPMETKRETRRYLRDIGRDKGYQTVNYLDTPGHTGKIIVK